jgi:transposase
METGVTYNQEKLHQIGYFAQLLASSKEVPAQLRPLLQLKREQMLRLKTIERALLQALQREPLLKARVQRLMSIPAIGPVTALTWALEIAEVQRFASLKKAISYCGLCGDQKSSAGVAKPTPLSKHKAITGGKRC